MLVAAIGTGHSAHASPTPGNGGSVSQATAAFSASIGRDTTLSRGWPNKPRRQVATLAEAARSAQQPRRVVAVRAGTPVVASSPGIQTNARIGDNEVALAPALRPGGNAPLPEPLAPSEAARLRRIFSAQAAGDLAAATAETGRLEDRRLLGHVLADRWLRRLGPAPGAGELQNWLATNADHPDAPRIYALLVETSPRGTSLPPPPPDAALLSSTDIVPEESVPASRSVVRNPALDRTVADRAQAGDAAGAVRLINGTRGMTPAYASLLQSELALVLFQQGKDEDAFAVASAAVRATPGHANAAFVAGLAAWGRNRFDVALPYFEAAARADDAPAVLRSAAAFWTARAAVRARKPQLYVSWMLQAAQEPRTFYGMVARRALGLPSNFGWERDLSGEAEAAALAETAGGWRALALLQVSQRDRAEGELRRLWPAVQGNPALSRASLAVATQSGMTEFAAQLAGLAQTADGRPRDFARFPVPNLRPQGGYRVDPSLIYALARQESNFDPGAVSPVGARGLMQLMPATASFISGDSSLNSAAGAQRLHDPGFSLDLGQRYLQHLAGQDVTGGSLIRILAAYNAGPGRLQSWQPNTQYRDDPFLYIEAIPIAETRFFVQRVLTYSWIYASRLGLPAGSLDALAAGTFPRFGGTPGADEMMRGRTQSVSASR